MDCPTIKPNPNFPFEFDLIISESTEIVIGEIYDTTIELQVHLPYDFDLFCRPLDSFNDEFVPIDSIIDVDYDLPIEFNLTMHRSSIFGIDESLLIDSPKVMYIVEDPMVDDTHVQVIICRSIPYDCGIVVS